MPKKKKRKVKKKNRSKKKTKYLLDKKELIIKTRTEWTKKALVNNSTACFLFNPLVIK